MTAKPHARQWCFRHAGNAPLIALAVVSVLSLGARLYRLDAPCQSPCTSTADRVLISDESYYVDAAQIIVGIRPPATLAAGQFPSYRDAPLGTDPNAEHPQGAKLVIAAAIELFGNGPFAWRIGAVLFGSLAILGLYALVRAAGGGPWLAVGAAALMSADNLMIVPGRLGLLDIYALAPMIWGVALYLRGRILSAAALLAVADCMKEYSVYALLVLGLFELSRALLRHRDAGLPTDWSWYPATKRLLIVVIGSSALFIAGLWAMGLVAPPSKEGASQLVSGGPFGHLSYIINFAKSFSNSAGVAPEGSVPWQWLFDYKPLTYLNVDPSTRRCALRVFQGACSPATLPGLGPNAVRPASAFIVMISPPIIAFALPGLLVCLIRAIRPGRGCRASSQAQVCLLAVAWFIGTWVPFELQNLVYDRVSWFYYMIVVMPGIYIAVASLAAMLWRRRRTWLRATIAVWALSVLAAGVVMYPFIATLTLASR